MSEETIRLIEARLREERRRLTSSLPSERLSLMDLKAGKRAVKLLSGELHELDGEEVERLLSLAPPYIWLNTHVPITLKYSKLDDGSVRITVEGDLWQRRLVELMLRGSFGVEGISEISVEEFRGLLSRYKTLFFISLDV